MEGTNVKSNTNFYRIQKLLDRGISAHVFRCNNLNTGKDVALKVHKNYTVFENEVYMQEIVSVLDPDKKSIVEFIENFTFNGHPCLVFELLDTSLFSMVYDKRWKTFSPNDIRPVAQQLLTAFDALKSIGVIHTDLKSDNIMLVNHSATPFRVKLIDFGLSITTSEAHQSYGVALQPMGNRAPEVALGLPFSEAIDMWSLGCVLSFLYLGNYLFLANSNYNMLRSMIEVVGRIPDHLLNASNVTHKYFKRSDRDNEGDHPKWRLMTEREYQDKAGVAPDSLPWSFKSLDDLLKLKPEVSEPLESEDRKAFVDLLKCLLQMDPKHRITPEDALKHPFLTMSHLSDHKTTSSYVIDSLDKMKFCPASNFEKEDPGQRLKPRNWRQRFCRFLGAKRTDNSVPPTGSGPRADEAPGRGPDAKSKGWRQNLFQFCRTNRKPDPLPPPGRGPKVQSEKTWWIKICLFFRVNRIVPEADHVPLRRASPPAKVRTHPDRDLHPGPDKSPQGDNDDRASSRLHPSTQMKDSSPVTRQSFDRSSQARDRSPAVVDDLSSPANHGKRSPVRRPSRPKGRSAPAAKTTRAHAPSRAKHNNKSLVNKPLRVTNDEWSRVNKLLRVKNDQPSSRVVNKPQGQNESSRMKNDKSRVKNEPSRAKLGGKNDESAAAHRSRVKKDKVDLKRAPARSRSDATLDLDYLSYLASGVNRHKAKKDKSDKTA
ncbi:homeodomain-interacting protein kinase 4-like [Syngnathoides biaculeatus]|uniref:homeodomain-interacting protein kinase 4-like n=1 Tax=Syngnathoides biaculeatus TaxID=300417 RepID=UPI002ADE6921|nr:homeodomain-interacting protein kinase 4-like [Syngnathoides biaculeatus]